MLMILPDPQWRRNLTQKRATHTSLLHQTNQLPPSNHPRCCYDLKILSSGAALDTLLWRSFTLFCRWFFSEAGLLARVGSTHPTEEGLAPDDVTTDGRTAVLEKAYIAACGRCLFLWPALAVLLSLIFPLLLLFLIRATSSGVGCSYLWYCFFCKEWFVLFFLQKIHSAKLDYYRQYNNMMRWMDNNNSWKIQ